MGGAPFTLISALTGIEGTVLFAIKAIKPIGSLCFLFNPVTVPSSPTPKYKTPPSVFVIPTISTTRSDSLNPSTSLLNSIVKVYFAGILLIVFTSINAL